MEANVQEGEHGCSMHQSMVGSSSPLRSQHDPRSFLAVLERQLWSRLVCYPKGLRAILGSTAHNADCVAICSSLIGCDQLAPLVDQNARVSHIDAHLDVARRLTHHDSRHRKAILSWTTPGQSTLTKSTLGPSPNSTAHNARPSHPLLSLLPTSNKMPSPAFKLVAFSGRGAIPHRRYL